MEVISGSGFLHSRDPIILFMWDIWRLLLVSCSSWGTKEKEEERKKERYLFIGGVRFTEESGPSTPPVWISLGGESEQSHRTKQSNGNVFTASTVIFCGSSQTKVTWAQVEPQKNCSKKSEKKLENHRRPSDAHTCISLFVLMSEESYRYQNLTGFLFFFFLRRAGWQVGWWNWVQPLLQ